MQEATNLFLKFLTTKIFEDFITITVLFLILSAYEETKQQRQEDCYGLTQQICIWTAVF